MASHSGGAQDAITVQLIDPHQGHSLQAWEFREQTLVRIGRSEGQEIVIVDPYVSRAHVELRRQDGSWWLFSLGRHGVLIDQQVVGQTLLRNGTTFRLGVAGPSFRFHNHLLKPKSSATLELNGENDWLLKVDNTTIRAEANAIAQQDYFQRLQSQARRLRDRRAQP